MPTKDTDRIFKYVLVLVGLAGMAVATRKVWTFEETGIDVFNPWDAT